MLRAFFKVELIYRGIYTTGAKRNTLWAGAGMEWFGLGWRGWGVVGLRQLGPNRSACFHSGCCC